METSSKYDVFISYSTVDKLIAEAVCGYLESHKIRCFVAHRDIPRGVEWALAIPPAIKESKMMLAVFSRSFNISAQADNELHIAEKVKIPVLTFRLSDDDFEGVKEYFLIKSNWIDAFPEPEKQFGELLKSIALLINRKEVVHNSLYKYERVYNHVNHINNMETQEKFDVFISYSNADKQIVEAICGYLESHKIRCFVAHRDIPRGVEWALAIPPAIKESKMMLAVFSRSFNISAQADNELHIAAKIKIPVLTFRLTDDDFEGVKEYFFIKSNWIDAFPEPEKQFGELLKSIALLINRKDVVQQ